jgi:nucleoside-diphosphate-sugar epimerase
LKKVLIAGATGYLGRYLIKEAKRQGYWVRTLARKANRLDDLHDSIDEICEAEITKPRALNLTFLLFNYQSCELEIVSNSLKICDFKCFLTSIYDNCTR